ncbi:glycoside hydrolase family 31 protein [Auriculariales sp. MPI-PUGE-AT-0066]|nr:glycoside hydrolase family 31 protein [Auriculariales sp. MPI-PUGE-AT-0066]
MPEKSAPTSAATLVGSRTMFRIDRAVLALLEWVLAIQHTADLSSVRRATSLSECRGYNAQNVITTPSSITADLVLAAPCGVYGNDLQKLTLGVTYEDEERLHVKIGATRRYEVPDSVFPRPVSKDLSADRSQLEFKYETTPFSFQVIRKSDKEVLFDTTNEPLVFEEQYLRIATTLPADANIYGLGEHTSTFRLPNNNYVRTLWNRDAYSVPDNSNLYGAHPVYYEHRKAGTHATFLLNSNGMDIKINQVAGKTQLEYNVIGGIFDFYFLAGSTTNPADTSRQYAKVVGLAAQVPWWSFGLHQCRFGYRDFVEVAEVIENYTLAGIPLETMWTDLDYFEDRMVFTNEEAYFPKSRIREIIDYLHVHNQRYILPVDPAVSTRLVNSNGAYKRGLAQDLFVKASNGTPFHGVVWPGVTVYPDWFHTSTQAFWTDEVQRFFNPETGWDIDGLWIDMNEPSSFCSYPCDAEEEAIGYPPGRLSAPPDPDTPIFTRVSKQARRAKRDIVEVVEFVANEAKVVAELLDFNTHTLSDQDLLEPLYKIRNDAGNGALSASTIYTNAKHQNGLLEYDVHNLYGTMMSTTSQIAMSARRPGKRTLVITRSTFPGAGTKVGKWLGDNLSQWNDYRKSIAGVLGFNTLYQIPMVGPDTCGFGGPSNENLCARWATLGAFYPFFRNHNEFGPPPQEFYRWPRTIAAAKAAIEMRFKLLDYLYTAMHQQSVDGTPAWNPLYFIYPHDEKTFGLDLQFFFGQSILVSPVTMDDTTLVTYYLPEDKFYNFKNFEPVEGKGNNVTENNVGFDEIPVLIRGGAILPLRVTGLVNTTTALRKVDFHIVVAPRADGTASGSLFVDDGESVIQQGTTNVSFEYAQGTLKVSGTFGYELGVKIAKVTILGTPTPPQLCMIDGLRVGRVSANVAAQTVEIVLNRPFTEGFTLTLERNALSM